MNANMANCRKCLVCPKVFAPRDTGGKPQLYCGANCRRMHQKARIAYTAAMEASGQVTPELVAAAVRQKA